MPQDFDCPTGECAEQEPDCRSVKEGDTIDPQSKLHIERNRCNRCPKEPPTPVVIEVHRERGRREKVITHWVDSEGNIWQADNAITATIFHGDPMFGGRNTGNQTYRVQTVISGGGRGWQCKYVGGVLDDTTSDMGTYDYAPAPSGDHWSMDVTPHFSNSGYAAGLTEKY